MNKSLPVSNPLAQLGIPETGKARVIENIHLLGRQPARSLEPVRFLGQGSGAVRLVEGYKPKEFMMSAADICRCQLGWRSDQGVSRQTFSSFGAHSSIRLFPREEGCHLDR